MSPDLLGQVYQKWRSLSNSLAWEEDSPFIPPPERLCWRMKDRVQSGMVTCLPDRVPARGATTMTRMHRLAKAYHGSGRACPCHVSPTYSPTSRIRQQSPKEASYEWISVWKILAIRQQICYHRGTRLAG